jgi:hypothetical protein
MQALYRLSRPQKGYITLQPAQNYFAIIKKKIWCEIYVNAMSQNGIVYLKYQNLEDMLKVIIYSAQSMLGVIPMLYYIHYNSKHVLFIQTGAVGGVTIHYVVENERPTKKFIQLKRLSGEFTFVDSIGTDAQSLYAPILGLEKSTLAFPTL